MYKKLNGLGDSFYQDKAKTINAELKKLKIPMYVVCGRIEKATGKPKMLWKRVGETCDSAYPNVRTTGESVVEKYFDKNLGGSSLKKFMSDPSGYAATIERKMKEVADKEKAELEKKLAKKAPKLTKSEKKKLEDEKAEAKKQADKEKREARKEARRIQKEKDEAERNRKAQERREKRAAKKQQTEAKAPEKVIETPKEEKVETKHERKARFGKGTTAYYNNEPVKIVSVISQKDGYKYIVELPSGNNSHPIDENDLRHAAFHKKETPKPEPKKENIEAEDPALLQAKNEMNDIKNMLAKLAA
jgi:hypothetical protein